MGVGGGKREEGVGDKYDGAEERVLTSYGSNLMVLALLDFLGDFFKRRIQSFTNRLLRLCH